MIMENFVRKAIRKRTGKNYTILQKRVWKMTIIKTFSV